MSMKQIAEAIEAQLARQNTLLEHAVKLMEPPREQPAIGHRSDLMPMSGDYMVRHVPVLQLAFKTVVPDKHLEVAPELARVNCPCGAVTEIMPGQIEMCHGPEDAECPRFYLYTGESVRVANTDLLGS